MSASIRVLLDEGHRRGHLSMPVVAIVTDVDPNPLWLADGIDAHVVAVPNDVKRLRQRYRFPIVALRPPIRSAFLEERDCTAARITLSLPTGRPIVLVCGGGWGVGHIDAVVDDLVAQGEMFVVVACGQNEMLRRLMHRYDPSQARALPFWEDMPSLFAACDLLVHTGAGVTCLEALTVGLPTILCNVLPGHGRRSAAALDSDDMVQWARNGAELTRAIAYCRNPPPAGRRPAARRGSPATALD